jgi:gluconate kinase
MKTVYILFGEMGCGKTYCGSRYAERHGFRFFDGDSVITPRMLDKVSRFKPISEDILEEYMDVLSNSIADQMISCDYLVVSQALYMNKDRESLKLFLESLGYRVRMWWVRVPLWRNVQNLLSRKDGWKWALYWLINKPFFQKPTHEHQIFYNIYR